MSPQETAKSHEKPFSQDGQLSEFGENGKNEKRFCDQVAACEEAEKQLAGWLVIRKWINKMLGWKYKIK